MKRSSRRPQIIKRHRDGKRTSTATSRRRRSSVWPSSAWPSDYVRREHRSPSSTFPSEDMKGRINRPRGPATSARARIWRTGVDLIVDDTPRKRSSSPASIRSAREIARISLEAALMADRPAFIRPASRKLVEKVRQELDQKLFEGRGGRGVLARHHRHQSRSPQAPRAVSATARRYGQNVARALARKWAQLAALMAVELGVNDTIAKARRICLHDIGKSIDREMEGTHLELGRQGARENTARKARDHFTAMECPSRRLTTRPRSRAVLVNAADALSAARPPARRREILENYVHRLEASRVDCQPDGRRPPRASPSRPAASSASSSTPKRSATNSRSGCRKTWPARSSRKLQYPGADSK